MAPPNGQDDDLQDFERFDQLAEPVQGGRAVGGPDKSVLGQGPAPPGANACPECGNWMTQDGKPFTEKGVLFHRRIKHGVNISSDSIKGKKELQNKAIPPPEPMEEDYVRFDTEDVWEKERRHKLERVLYAEQYHLNANERAHILRQWDSIEILQQEPRAFSDMLTELKPLKSNPRLLTRIVDSVFEGDTSTSSQSSPYYPRGYQRPSQEPPYASSYRGYGGDKGYGQRGMDRGYDRFRVPRREPLSPAEVEDMRRRDWEDWEREQKLREQQREIDRLKDRIERPPPKDDLTKEDVLEIVVKAVRAGNEDPKKSEELRKMELRMEEMRMDMQKAREENIATKAANAATADLRPLVEKLQKEKDEIDAVAKARQAAREEAQALGLGSKNVSEDTQVLIAEMQNQTSKQMKVMDNLHKTVSTLVPALVKGSQPINTHQGETSDMSASERERLKKELGDDFVD